MEDIYSNEIQKKIVNWLSRPIERCLSHFRKKKQLIMNVASCYRYGRKKRMSKSNRILHYLPSMIYVRENIRK